MGDDTQIRVCAEESRLSIILAQFDRIPVENWGRHEKGFFLVQPLASTGRTKTYVISLEGTVGSRTVTLDLNAKEQVGFSASATEPCAAVYMRLIDYVVKVAAYNGNK